MRNGGVENLFILFYTLLFIEVCAFSYYSSLFEVLM